MRYGAVNNAFRRGFSVAARPDFAIIRQIILGRDAAPRLLEICLNISMASIGLPGLNGFIGEFLSLAGMFKSNPLYAALATTGVVLGAWYLLTAVQRVFFGTLKEPHQHGHGDEEITDMNPREFLALAPLVVLCLWIGVRPAGLIEIIEPDIKAVVDSLDAGSPGENMAVVQSESVSIAK